MIAAINPAFFAPIGGVIGGTAAWAAHIWTRDKAVGEARTRSTLVEDEILGHRGVRGLPDKKGLSERLALVELGVGQVQRELHPNGGTSLADTIMATHRLAEQAADHATGIARDLSEDRDATERLGDLFQQHNKDDDRRFAEVAALLRRKTP